MARIRTNEVTATNIVCAQPSNMQCHGKSGLCTIANGSAIVALVIAPSVVGPATNIAKLGRPLSAKLRCAAMHLPIKEHEMNRNQECRRRNRHDATNAVRCTRA